MTSSTLLTKHLLHHNSLQPPHQLRSLLLPLGLPRRCWDGRWMPVATRGLTQSTHHPQRQLTRTNRLRLPPGKMTRVIKQGIAEVCRGDMADQVGVRAVHDKRCPRVYSSPTGMRGPIAKSKRHFTNKKKNMPVKPSATTWKSTKQRSRRSFTSNNVISLAAARK